MTDEIKLKLLSEFEYQFIGILLENHVCEYIRLPKSGTSKKLSNSFANVKFKEKYQKIYDIPSVTLDWVKTISKNYVTGRTGTPSVIKAKAERFITNHPHISLDTITEAMRAYTEHIKYENGGKYAVNLDNLFYKKEGEYEKSPIIGIISKFIKDIASEIKDDNLTLESEPDL